MTVITYPIPLYQNLPIESDFYQPSRFVISSINLGITTQVTTTEDLNYERLIIPPAYGCYQLNGQTGIVLEVSSTDTVILNIDSSRNVDAYIAADQPTPAQILAIGDVNSGNISADGAKNVPTNIIGSFINISPE